MDEATLAVGGLAASVAGGVIVAFFRSPNQQISELKMRVDALENDHQLLDKDFARFSTKVDQLGVEVRELTLAVRQLTRSIDRGKPRYDTSNAET